MNTQTITATNFEFDKSLLNYFNPDKITLKESYFDEFFYEKNQMIYQEGNTPMGIYHLKSGKIKIFKLRSDGREQIIRIAQKGDYIGYKDLLLNNRFSDNAEVIEDASLYFIPKKDFMEALENNQEVAGKFAELLCRILLDTEKKMTDCTYLPVRGRLAETLLTFREYEEGNPHPVVVLTRNNLAGYIGTAVETLVRTLSDFKDEKLVTTKGKTITILNPEGLQRVISMYN